MTDIDDFFKGKKIYPPGSVIHEIDRELAAFHEKYGPPKVIILDFSRPIAPQLADVPRRQWWKYLEPVFLRRKG